MEELLLLKKTTGKPRVLVAPLDWGLGHATRCIPIISELLKLDCDVWLAGEGAQEKLLKTEFPQLPFLELPGYRIKYSKTKQGLVWKMLRQGPKMRRAISHEHSWLKKMVKKFMFDAVISDNRFGLHHPGIPCIFMTHQLRIKSSAGKWTEKLLQKRNYQFINKFRACWVPDHAGESNWAGDLSHPSSMPSVPVHYIGLLSRFENKPAKEKKNYLLVLLSGPEPQRTILEEKIIKGIWNYNGAATIVRGLPGELTLIPSTGMIHFYNHLPTQVLNNEMLEAEYIISRSGYSTVMDIAVLNKKSILVPTPGQTEQEYLGKYLSAKKMAVCVDQEKFSVQESLASVRETEFLLPGNIEHDSFKKTIGDFILTLKNQL
jgi:uncharacterized protein (TIGR00661 family)